MDAHALTIKAVRDRPVCTLVLSDDLDLLETGGFLQQAALAVDDRAGQLGVAVAGVLVLGCAGVGVLRIATRLAPGGCPLGPAARRIVELLGFDRANVPELSLGDGLRDGPRDSRTSQQELAPVEPGAPFPAGSESCP
jgi:hypothetical protein